MDTINKNILDKRLKIIQEKLLEKQIKKNKALEGQIVEVLVENLMKDKVKLFGRNQYMSPVIFDGDPEIIGKIVNVQINYSNKNSLFGKLINKLDTKVA